MDGTKLSPVLRDRVRRALGARGWPRPLVVRRALAGLLVLAAAVLAVQPASARGTPTRSAVVAAHDLAPGRTLTTADLRLRALPADALPTGALTDVSATAGRVLGGALRSGQPITDVNLLGAQNTALVAGRADAASVPVRLADPGVAGLLRPGASVDVVAADPSSGSATTLATGAKVVTVRDSVSTSGEHGQLVLLALPRDVATRVAAAALRQPVTVTLR